MRLVQRPLDSFAKTPLAVMEGALRSEIAVPPSLRSGWYCPHPDDRWTFTERRKRRKLHAVQGGMAGAAGSSSANKQRRQAPPSGGGGGAATAVADLVASRTSGPAPLGVVFDATASTSSAKSDDFLDPTYTFDYGESPGTWTYGRSTANSKATDVGGPIGAHVFETPGTYEVTVTVNDGGTLVSDTVTITVYNPDDYYKTSPIDGGSNRATVYVAPAGTNFVANGAQAAGGGVSHLEQSTAVTSPAANTRYLYLGGNSYSGAIVIPGNTSAGRQDIQIGKFGSGTLTLTSVQVNENAGGITSTPSFAEKVTIMNATMARVLHYGCTRYLTIKGCTFTSTTEKQNLLGEAMAFWIFGGNGSNRPTSEYNFPYGVVLCENTYQGSAALDNDTYGVFLNAGYMCAVLGCFFSTFDEHNFRAGHMTRGFIAHNEARGISNSGGKHSIKLHALGSAEFNTESCAAWTSSAANVSPCSRLVVIAWNVCSSASDNNAWPISVMPQNDDLSTDEGLRDILIEGNQIITGSGNVSDIATTGHRISTVNNVRTNGSTAATISATKRTSGLPSGWTESYPTARS